MTESEQERRRRRRSIVRMHHPDVGGDPAVLRQLLQRLDQKHEPRPSPLYQEVRFVKQASRRRQAGRRLAALTRHLSRTHRRRSDGKAD